MLKLKFEMTSGRMLAGSIIVAVLLMVLIVPLSLKSSTIPTEADDLETRIQPVAKLELVAAPTEAAAAAGPMDGPTVYNSVCVACHGSGAAGSPKTGDKAAWGPRIATGKPALYNSALNGKNAMPARGGKATLSDAEVKAAVDYLIGQAK